MIVIVFLFLSFCTDIFIFEKFNLKSIFMKAMSFVLFLFTINLFAQVKFEKGYFIDSQNKKVECLIKNKDWIGSPSEIELSCSIARAIRQPFNSSS